MGKYDSTSPRFCTYFWMEICVLKISGFLFGWDAVTKMFLYMQEYHIVKLSKHDMKPAGWEVWWPNG